MEAIVRCGSGGHWAGVGGGSKGAPSSGRALHQSGWKSGRSEHRSWKDDPTWASICKMGVKLFPLRLKKGGRREELEPDRHSMPPELP